jgi:hypothetical protein
MKPQPAVSRDRTLPQLTKILEATQSEDRSLKRLIKIHEAAQLELQELEADFQIRLRESIQQTEARLKQRFAEEQLQETKRNEEEVRKTVTRNLLARFEVEFQKLSAEFEQRRQNAIAATEHAAQLRLQEVVAEAEHAKEDLNREFQSAAHKWETERRQFEEKISKLGQQVGTNQGKARLEKEFREAEAGWNVERETLRAEMQQSRREMLSRFEKEMEQLKTDFEERRQKEVAATESAAEIRFAQTLAETQKEFERCGHEFETERNILNQRIGQLQEELAGVKQGVGMPANKVLKPKLSDVTSEKNRLERELRQAGASQNTRPDSVEAIQAARTDRRDVSTAVKAEVSRIQSTIDGISRKMEHSELDLGEEIRLNRERSELESYLKGLRYSIGEITFDNPEVTLS